MIRTMKDRGITLLALVVTIVVLLILAGITISLVFGPNGVIKKAQEADENTKIAQVREKLELAKGPEYIEGNGQYDPDSYFQRIEDEKIINDKDKDVVDNEDGTYDVTTTPGYIFIITLVPSKDNVEDIQIDYIGKVDGPRIREVNVSNKTTSSISVEVETSNAEGATYTYYYKKEGKTEWIKAGESKEWTYTFNGLEANVIYNIKVVVEKDGKTAEKETSTITGELPEGAVQFSPVEWKNGQASTVITTTETGYTLQYQIGGIEESGWTNTTSGTTIENLQHGTTVYGRLFDGTNGSKTASIDIKDEVSPTVTVAEETITTNSISVNVQAGDSESGMADVPTYTYYIKKNGEANSSYTSPTEATGITQNTYTFAGLIQGTSYDIKVEVNGDKAGNIGTGTLLNKTTEEIGGPTDGLLEGNIIASSPTWSNGTASIILSTNTGLTIQHQVNGIDDNSWTTGTKATGLNHNDTVYARLTDGTNYGDEASVTIKDNIGPNVSLSISNITSNGMTLTVTADDEQTGLAASETYQYYLESTLISTNTNKNYTYTGLKAETKYTLKVVVKDKANNKTEKTISQNTASYPLAKNILKEGDYVNYIDYYNSKRRCIVLYGPNSSYGLQIVTDKVLTTIKLGDTTSFNASKQSYNNLINILNSKVREYLNKMDGYATAARSIGTSPTNYNKDTSSYYSGSYDYMSSYNGEFKQMDTVYTTDYNKMRSLGIHRILGSSYFLAARYLEVDTAGADFAVRIANSSGSLTSSDLCMITNSKVAYQYAQSSGVRGVFILRNDLKIVGGNGTASSPYELGR